MISLNAYFNLYLRHHVKMKTFNNKMLSLRNKINLLRRNDVCYEVLLLSLLQQQISIKMKCLD